MDRETFDRERLAVQDELREMGQEIEIPDPNTPDYLSTFLALQRSHPRLAARLAEAESADPAELLDPYTPRAPKITPRHRLNAFVEKNFMRRGLDRKLVMDRQRVFRAALYTAGGILVGGLVWSVAAPQPTVTAESTTQTTRAATPPQGAQGTQGKPAAGDTAGAFAPIEGEQDAAQDTAEETIPTSPAGDAASRATPPDSAPQPVSAASSSPTTPPPPEVFNQVANDPYAPAPAPASVPEPSPTPLAVDSTPTPVAVAPAPAASSPFGGEAPSTPEPVVADSTPLASPFVAPEPVTVIPAPVPDRTPPDRTPPTSPFADSSAVPKPAPPKPVSPAVVDSPFGGEDVTPNAVRPVPLPPQTATAAQQEDPPVRGAAMIYQAPRNEAAQSAPRTAMIEQAPRNEAAQSAPRTAMIYQSSQQPAAQDEQAASVPRSALLYQTTQQATAQTTQPQSAMLYQASAQTTGASGSSIIAQSQAPTEAPSSTAGTQAQGMGTPTTATFGQAVDPDAPRFAPTSVIAGKLFTSIRAAAGMAVPVVVLSQDGNWVGSASYNTSLGRVDMRFTSFVMLKNSKVYPVFATAYQRAANGTLSEGVGASVRPIAPTLALDLARAGLNGLNAYTQALQNAGTTSYSGSLVTTTRQAPELVQVLRGEVGKVFALPEGNQSIQIVADIAAGTEVQLVYGVGSNEQEFDSR
jgi:hypothetical protein